MKRDEPSAWICWFHFDSFWLLFDLFDLFACCFVLSNSEVPWVQMLQCFFAQKRRSRRYCSYLVPACFSARCNHQSFICLAHWLKHITRAYTHFLVHQNLQHAWAKKTHRRSRTRALARRNKACGAIRPSRAFFCILVQWPRDLHVLRSVR